jgi:two-component system, NarL family, response regulator DevR
MTLFIADTNDRVRQCLASLAACVEGIEVVGEAGDVQEAIGGIKRAKPDSVIVALQMSGGSGIDVLSAAKSTNPATVIIMLTVDERSECKLNCLAQGADYLFEKSGEVKKIVTTLVLLARGRDRFAVR